MDKTYIGIDPGENLGFAVIDSDLNVIDSGAAPIEKGLSESDLFLAIVSWMREFLKKYPTKNRVGIEDAAFSPRFRNILTDEIRGLIKYCVADAGLRWEKVSISSVKKAITGSGKAKKREVQRRVEETFKMECQTSHEADALAVAYFLVRESYLEGKK